MILELTADTDHITAYEAQSYFNSSQSKFNLSGTVYASTILFWNASNNCFHICLDHDYECPFCFAKVIIVLSTSMIVGDAQQLDYQKTLDKAS